MNNFNVNQQNLSPKYRQKGIENTNEFVKG